MTTAAGRDFPTSWSPDGSRILLSSQRDGNYEIYVTNADGSGQTNLTNNAAPDREAHWSPDGSRIVFASLRDDRRPQLRDLRDGCAGDFSPWWGPIE